MWFSLTGVRRRDGALGPERLLAQRFDGTPLT